MFRAGAFALAFLILAATFTASVHGRSTASRGRVGGRHGGGHVTGHGAGGGHLYPPSHGLSGHGAGGGHHYPPSQGLSGHGSGSGHLYPPSQGLSGHGSGSGHQYPPSRLSGHGTNHNGHTHSSTGNSNHGSGGTTNNIYHVYHPPQKIQYVPVHGAAPAQPYPIYHQTPPIYVNNYRDSGSKFSTLLTGLALYNLGRSTLPHHHSHDHARQDSDNGEKCSLRIEDGRNLDIVSIPCYMASTFNDVTDKKLTTTPAPAPSVTTPTTPTPSTVPSTTQAPTVPGAIANATAGNATSANETLSSPVANATVASSGQNSTSVANATTIPQNTTALQNSSTVQKNATEPVDPLKLKGEPVKLSNGARCFVERQSKMRRSVHEIECGLLQQYALQSMQRQRRNPNSAAHNKLPFVTIFMGIISVYALC